MDGPTYLTADRSIGWTLRSELPKSRQWRGSSLEVRRRYVEFFGTLAVFGLYSELYGTDYEYAVMSEGV
jgi:hypothetical protein